ncbi:hypothetical protein VSS74_21230 [Conexibacter stalactiti]|uniref:Pyridoxamine 5'-phosphate oxidase putative domain-containing protein n=1 Tax=Conexibacter stalactiti TaxID=1940611 RepID=A0ABU4HXV0_9ACTN|nr:hypothetical protein [Conexibacter stalactiti]MDW5596884.1 hypothetical protein [Conexibacter stalactiti]MEC5037526.1 hypothetical protein [Conexibacter stalactiti]
MSRPLDPLVPEALRTLLAADPGDAAVDGFTLLLLTTRADGWPHQAMLSVGEVVCAPGADDLLTLAVWPGATSTANLRERGRATLTAVVDGVAYALFLAVEAAGDVGRLARFDARVVAASADEAPYARLDGGIRFTLTDRDATIDRWRATREELAAS